MHIKDEEIWEVRRLKKEERIARIKALRQERFGGCEVSWEV